MEQLISLNEVGARLGVSVRTVHRLRKGGKDYDPDPRFPRAVTVGKREKWRESAIERYLDGGQETA